MIRSPLTCALGVALTLAFVAACGKKGPPLAPLSNRPRAPEAVSARRQGDQVLVRFTVPRANQSGVQPANIERVDVYALTGPKLPAARFVEHATLIGSVAVRRPPPPEGEEDAAPAAAPGDPAALDQGAQGVVTEALTPAAFEPVVVEEVEETAKREARRRQRLPSPIVLRRTPLAAPEIGVPVKPSPVRYYSAVGVNRSGRRGTPSAPVAVPLEPVPPPAPAQPSAQVRERAVELTWDRPPGLRGGRPAQDGSEADPSAATTPQAPEEEPADGIEDEIRDDSVNDGEGDAEDDTEDEPSAANEPGAATDPASTVPPIATAPAAPSTAAAGSRVLTSKSLLPWPSVTSAYNVYVVASADTEPAKVSPHAASSLPELLNPRPLPSPTYSDTRVEFGSRRCYVVRSVQTTGTTSAESEASPPVCVEVVDVFPPGPPKSLAAVAAESSINLIWEANGEPDLGGYLVLRSDQPEGPLQPVGREPIRETTWRDTTVKSGVRYRYAVVAVDNASPANRSEPSNVVEVSAR